jgi:hypothetical protein
MGLRHGEIRRAGRVALGAMLRGWRCGGFLLDDRLQADFWDDGLRFKGIDFGGVYVWYACGSCRRPCGGGWRCWVRGMFTIMIMIVVF